MVIGSAGLVKTGGNRARERIFRLADCSVSWRIQETHARIVVVPGRRKPEKTLGVTIGRPMEFTVRELSPIETHDLRRRVSAAGRISLPSWDHELDEASGSWHLGAVESQGTVVAMLSLDMAQPAHIPTEYFLLS